MDELIEKLRDKYANNIADINIVGNAEITINLKVGTDAEEFSRDLQNHLIETVDELTIVKINIVDSEGNRVDSFATNQ